MNPKISIEVDSNNKAVITTSGLVSVGSLVDVEVTGLTADNVPTWTSSDLYAGKSLRLRIVDHSGTDLALFPLVEKTSSADNDKWTVSDNTFKTNDGTSTTPVLNLDTEGLRKFFNGVPVNGKLEFGVILDSYIDSVEYAVGTIKISQWVIASQNDPTTIPNWSETLEDINDSISTISTSVSSASTSATNAASSETSAATSATNASASATSASTSASSAATSASNASTSESNASTSATSASASATSAATSATSAASSATSAWNALQYKPIIGDNGNWYVWNAQSGTSGAYVDTNVGATGPQGLKGDQGIQGPAASVIQVRNPTTGKWHYMYARQNTDGSYVLSLDQDEDDRDGSYIIPEGGTAGQVLRKNSAANYDAGWSDSGSGDVTGATMNGSTVTKTNGVLALGTVLTNASQFDSAGTASSSIATHLADTTNLHVTSSEKTTWNGKQSALPTTGTASDTYAINVSGNAATSTSATTADGVAWSGVGSKPTTLAGYGITDAKIESGVITLGSNTITPIVSGDLASVATSGSYADLINKPTIPSEVTESTVTGWGFTKNTGTYSKPDSGIPSTDLASSVQLALTDSRTPTTHASTHATGGTDAITPASIGAMASSVTHLSDDVENKDTSTLAGIKVVATDPGSGNYVSNVLYFIKGS